jgi:O-antigen/teichoic acid export membrane protein
VSKRPGIAGNAVVTMGVQAVTTVASIAAGIIIARALGPSGRGYYAYAITALGILLTYTDAASNAIMVQYRTDGLPSRLVYRAMLRVLLPVTVALTGGTILVSRLVPGQGVLLAVAFALPFALYSGVAISFFVADGAVQRANAVNAISTGGLVLIVAPLAAFRHLSVATMLGAWVFTYVMAAAVTAVWTRPYAGGEVASGDVRAVVKPHVHFLLKSIGLYVMAYLNMRINIFIIVSMLGNEMLGLYSLAIATGEMLWKWSQAVNWSALGRIAGDPLEEVTALTAKLTRVILLVQGTLALILFAVAPWLITAVYGAKFAGAVAPLRMLLPGIVAYSIEIAFGFFLTVRLKRPFLNLCIQGGSVAGCAVLTVLLLPHYGLVGAAFATTMSYIVTTVLVATIYIRITHTRVVDLIVPRREDFAGVIDLATKYVSRFALWRIR